MKDGDGGKKKHLVVIVIGAHPPTRPGKGMTIANSGHRSTHSDFMKARQAKRGGSR